MKHHGKKVKQPYTFTGREWDKETGLYYYRARYYNPQIGRFITKDPLLSINVNYNITFLLSVSLISPQEFNAYQYVFNQPVNRVDAYGLKDYEFSFSIEIGGAVGYYIVGGSVFDATISEINTGKKCRYTIKCFGVGVGIPEINITSKPVSFSTKDCKDCSEFEGYGYIGEGSVVVGGGISVGGGIKIPNGPFIPGDLLGWNYGGIRIGVSHSLCHFDCYSY